MGNEGSLPEGQGTDDEFEQQARAPPSHSNPPETTNNMNQGSRTGGRMINAVHKFRDKNKQNHTETMMSYPSAQYPTINGDGSLSVEQQQPYYQQQHESYQIQQPLVHAPQHDGPQLQQQQQIHASGATEGREVGVMYQQSPSRLKKGGMNFKSGKGASIINSMKNLSIKDAIKGAATKSGKGGDGGEEVNDWETKWDEDDDDDDDEDESDEDEEVEKPPITPLHPQVQQQVDNMGFAETPQQKAHLVTATPENDVYPPQRLAGEDGGNWSTGIVQGQPPGDKPNVQMFLPLLRVLGKGSFGKVVLVQKRQGKERGALFAMKILRKTHLVKRRQIERTRTERKVLSVVNHPFIMKLHYAFQSPEKLYLVLDYCPGGELFFHLSRFRRFPERVARFYAAELLLALGHLHKRGIIYRDLKPENVLLDADGHVKLGDFGLAKAGIKNSCEGATSMCGTPEYMAPEVLAQQGHGFCVDYWGLGMLVYEMMTGLPPWYTTDRPKLFRRLRSAPLDIPTYFSQSSASYVSALLERNPRRRLGVTGVRLAMEHDFFRSISWRALYGRKVEAPIRPCEGWNPPEAFSDDSPAAAVAVTDNNNNANSDNNDDPLNLDAATANFDNTFTRMPVETEDKGNNSDEEMEELNEDTFVGFTFDDDKDREDSAAAAVHAARQRTHHYNHNTYEAGHSNDTTTGHQID